MFPKCVILKREIFFSIDSSIQNDWKISLKCWTSTSHLSKYTSSSNVAVGCLRSLSPIPIHWATCSSCFVQDYHEFGVPPTEVGMNECSQHPQRQRFRVIHKCLPVGHPKMVLKAPLLIAKILSFFSQYPKLELSNLNIKMFTTCSRDTLFFN